MSNGVPVIRTFVESDAEGIAALFRDVYGSTYPMEYFYDPDAIRKRVADGIMQSVIAQVDGQVAGHVSMTFTPSLGIPERGQSVVSPSCQGMGLFRKMLECLHSLARRRGIAGLFNEAVTTHPYSQKGSYSAGARECGIQLNYIPEEVNCGMGSHSHSRRSVVLFYANLEDNPVSPVFLPNTMRAIITRIYENLGITLLPPDDRTPVTGDRTIYREVLSPFRTGQITILSYGHDFPAVLDTAFADERTREPFIILLELPMGSRYLLRAVREAQRRGFFFSGVIPRYFAHDDCLRMQYIPPHHTVNWKDMELSTGFARLLGSTIRRRFNRRSGHGRKEPY